MAVEFKWNREPKKEPDPHQLAEERAGGVHGRMSHLLVDIHSTLTQLKQAYLSSEQKRDLAEMLKNAFFGLQELTLFQPDEEGRRALTHYLVTVGSLGVTLPNGKLLTLSEALSRGTLVEWVGQFYDAAHRTAGYALDERALDAERCARRDLMHLIQHKE